jgi:hypothetical protein
VIGLGRDRETSGYWIRMPNSHRIGSSYGRAERGLRHAVVGGDSVDRCLGGRKSDGVSDRCLG